MDKHYRLDVPVLHAINKEQGLLVIRSTNDGHNQIFLGLEAPNGHLEISINRGDLELVSEFIDRLLVSLPI